ncbi:MAG: hypothetical protein UHX00_15355, partial [Caryophanon sp.]|nr:hypothetical protein [Caryophanon sp.]
MANGMSEVAKQQEKLNVVKKYLDTYGIDERFVKIIINHTGGNKTSIEKVNSFLDSFNIGYFYNEVVPLIEELEGQYSKKSKAVAILKERLEKKKCKQLVIDIAIQYLLDGQPMTTLADELEEAAKTVTQKENIVALQSLVNELAKDHAYLVKLDVPFCDDIVKHRPLV